MFFKVNMQLQTHYILTFQPKDGALSFHKCQYQMGLVQFGIGNLGSVRVDAPTKAGAALKGIEVSIDIARWRETSQTQGRLALTLAFGLD